MCCTVLISTQVCLCVLSNYYLHISADFSLLNPYSNKSLEDETISKENLNGSKQTKLSPLEFQNIPLAKGRRAGNVFCGYIKNTLKQCHLG